MIKEFKLRPISLALAIAFCGVASAQEAALQQPADVADVAKRVGAPVDSGDKHSDAPIEFIPRSVVLARDVIDNQGAKTLSDALRNVSNVNALDARDSNNQAFSVRGFIAATVVDGVVVPGYFPNQESLVNLERIDVMKGPASGLYGGFQGAGGYGTSGGVVAITTSEPVQTNIRKLGIKVGSYGEQGASFDLNQPVSAELALRLIGEIAYSDSETDRVFFKRQALFPSLAWTPDADTKLVVRLRYVDNTTLDYSGLPAGGTLLDFQNDSLFGGLFGGSTATSYANYRLPRSMNLTANGLPDTTNTSRGINLQWTQNLSDVWQLSLVAALNETELDQRTVFPSSLGLPYLDRSTTRLLMGGRLSDQSSTKTLAPRLTGHFNAGELKQTVSLGMDYVQTKDHTIFNEGYLVGGSAPAVFGTSASASSGIDLTAPVYLAWVEPILQFAQHQRNQYTSTTVYVQDQLHYGNWHVLAGLHHLRINVKEAFGFGISGTGPFSSFGLQNESSYMKTTPRLALAYELGNHLSAFAAYSEGFDIQPTQYASSGFSLVAVLPPLVETKQTELGLQLASLHGVTAKLAWFDLVQKNASTSLYSTLAKRRVNGVDLDLRWQATPTWSWLAALTSQQAYLTQPVSLVIFSATPTVLNRQLFNIPEKTARLATRYEIDAGAFAGVGLGLGVTYSGRLAGDTANNFFTPPATVWDAQVSYTFKDVRLGLNINNLADKRYYVPSNYFGGGQVIPALPRTVTATANFSF